MKTTTKAAIMFLAMLFTFSVTSGQGLKGKPKEKEDVKEKEKNNSSSDTKERCYDENTHIINLGVGLGGGNYYSGYRGYGHSYKVSPAFSLSYEQAYPKKLGPGYLGLGAYVGFQSASSTYNYYYDDNGYEGNYYYKHSWRNFMIAARGAYHLDFVNAEKAELYAGLLAGLRIQSYNYESDNPDPKYYNYRYTGSNVFPTYSLFVGARWYFVPKVALFAEAGYGISYITGGFSFKF